MKKSSLIPDTCSLLSEKSELRKRMTELRAEAFAKNENAPRALRENFLKEITLPPGSVVSSYRAYGGEMDPAPLTAALREKGHIIALPVMTGRREPLIFRIYENGGSLIANKLGIEEPAPGSPEIEPDVLLVPLLAFDRHGGRLGMGGGYYDRTIANLRLRKRILTVGIGYSCQEIAHVPLAPHDAKIDRIVTETQVF